ncbi:MAG: 2-C-methyl-D-erythritol 2,4-cyclodiphosphate synthase [Syntrophaceae bacterium]
MPYRIGTGFDIHRLVEGRKLILGGLEIPYEKGLLGHSDGDVIVHAVADAILGAVALGDIGAWFPDTAKETKDMYSLDMLPRIMANLGPAYTIVNIDVNCIAEHPKLSPFREAIRGHIAKAAGIDVTQVSVKFRTHERLGDIGAGNAIAAQAVVLLEMKNKKSEDKSLESE